MSLYRHLGRHSRLSTLTLIRHTPSHLPSAFHAKKTPCLSQRLWPVQNTLGRRAFSAAAFVESSVATTTQLITGLHVFTGTPWFVTIPLVAVAVNVLIRLPLTIYSRSITQKSAKLLPLIQAWTTRHFQDVDREPLSESAKRKEAMSRHRKTVKRISREAGVQQWKLYTPLLILPVWLNVMEAVRRMCGGPRGLLGTALFPRLERDTDGPDVADAAALPGSVPSTVPSSNSPAPVDTELLSDLPTHLPAVADPSLATGGCLWFPDLLVPDPLAALPALLSVALLANIIPKSAKGVKALFGASSKAKDGSDTLRGPLAIQSGVMLGLQRGLLILALVVPLITINLPSALLLYWLSSATTTLVLTETVAWFMPIPKTKVRLCKGNESTFIKPPPPGV